MCRYQPMFQTNYLASHKIGLIFLKMIYSAGSRKEVRTMVNCWDKSNTSLNSITFPRFTVLWLDEQVVHALPTTKKLFKKEANASIDCFVWIRLDQKF